MKQKFNFRHFAAVAAVAFVSAAMSLTAYAGAWIRDEIGWWWQNDDGSYPASCWQWIDGNSDGTAECYYFDGGGYMLENTVTPDGYSVNESGAWTENGQVVTQASEKFQITTTYKTYTGQNDSDTNDDRGEDDYWDYFDDYSDYYDYSDYSDDSDDYYSSGSYTSGGQSTSSENIDAEAYAYEVFELVNKERAARGLNELEWNDEVADCAQIRAAELVEKFSHVRPDGSSCFTIFDENGVERYGAGENIAAGQTTPEQVMNEWMNSPGHKANILEENFDEMGVGFYHDPSSNYRYFWVQLFIGVR